MATQLLMDENATISVADRLFLGEGLFETIKIDKAKPCYPELHWQRLKDAAMQLEISFTMTYEVWLNALMQQIQQNHLTQGGIKVILSGGTAARGLAEHGKENVLLFQTFHYQRPEHPLKLISAPWLRDGSNPLYQFKTINYLESVLAKRHALSQGAEDVLFFNLAKHATETTIANFFMIQQNTVFTPPLRDGVLPGITRQRIINFCKEQQIECRELSITLEMIAEAEALFCCNSLQGIRLICSLDDLTFSSTPPLLDELIRSI